MDLNQVNQLGKFPAEEDNHKNEYTEVFPDLQGTENLLNVSFAPGENSYLHHHSQND